MQGKQSHTWNWLLLSLMRISTYVGLFLLFYGFMSIHNWTLQHASRTTAIVLLTWFSMTLAMIHIYGGYEIGRKKNKPIFSAMSLAVLCTDLMSYLALQIMNTNANNNAHLMLFGNDLLPLIGCYLLQVPFVWIMVSCGNRLFFRLHPPKRCLVILGRCEDARSAVKKIERYRLQWQIVRVINEDDPSLMDLLQASDVVFLSDVTDDLRVKVQQQCYAMRKDLLCKAHLQEIMLATSHPVVVDDSPYLEMKASTIPQGQKIVKRCMDVTISLLVLSIGMPLLLLIALFIKLEDGGQVLYKQKRMTVDGRVFTIYKFRTMLTDHHPARSAQQYDDRITRFGRFLRRFRLDELPQFFNILKGDMSLVGPRPEMLENVTQYKAQLPSFVYRERMKAGLTGYAQIEGRYNTTPEDKLMLDLLYIESYSIWLDVKLIFRTLTVLFKPESTQGFETQDQ